MASPSWDEIERHPTPPLPSNTARPLSHPLPTAPKRRKPTMIIPPKRPRLDQPEPVHKHPDASADWFAVSKKMAKAPPAMPRAMAVSKGAIVRPVGGPSGATRMRVPAQLPTKPEVGGTRMQVVAPARQAGNTGMPAKPATVMALSPITSPETLKKAKKVDGPEGKKVDDGKEEEGTADGEAAGPSNKALKRRRAKENRRKRLEQLEEKAAAAVDPKNPNLTPLGGAGSTDTGPKKKKARNDSSTQTGIPELAPSNLTIVKPPPQPQPEQQRSPILPPKEEPTPEQIAAKAAQRAAKKLERQAKLSALHRKNLASMPCDRITLGTAVPPEQRKAKKVDTTKGFRVLAGEGAEEKMLVQVVTNMPADLIETFTKEWNTLIETFPEAHSFGFYTPAPPPPLTPDDPPVHRSPRMTSEHSGGTHAVIETRQSRRSAVDKFIDKGTRLVIISNMLRTYAEPTWSLYTSLPTPPSCNKLFGAFTQIRVVPASVALLDQKAQKSHFPEPSDEICAIFAFGGLEAFLLLKEKTTKRAWALEMHFSHVIFCRAGMIGGLMRKGKGEMKGGVVVLSVDGGTVEWAERLKREAEAEKSGGEKSSAGSLESGEVREARETTEEGEVR